MKVGSIAIPKHPNGLASGCNIYKFAIVVSTKPFVLVSEEGDMLWANQKPEDFEFNSDMELGIAEKMYYKAFKRFYGDPSNNPSGKDLVEPIRVRVEIDHMGFINFDNKRFYNHLPLAFIAKQCVYHYLEIGAIMRHLKQYIFNGYLDKDGKFMGFSQPKDAHNSPIQPAFLELIERQAAAPEPKSEIKLEVAPDGLTTFRKDLESLDCVQYHYLEIGAILRHFEGYIFAGYLDDCGEKYFEQPSIDGHAFVPNYIFLKKQTGEA